MSHPGISQVKLLRDLRRHIKSVNPGSEPFASGLKAIESAAWSVLLSRGIAWTALGNKTVYDFRVTTYVSSPEGTLVTHKTLERKPKPAVFSAYQRGVRALAQKALFQYDTHVRWVFDRFDDALDCTDLNGRTRLRTLTGKAAFETLVNGRLNTIQRMVAGASLTATDSRFKQFVDRHGTAHIYRDAMFATRREMLNAQREDSMEVPADHDLIVLMFEEAFPPTGFDDAKFDELVRYMRSQDHRDALKFSTQTTSATPGGMKRHDQIVMMIANAERKLAPLDDPLPANLHLKLGVSKSYLVKLMKGKKRNKQTVRAALREAMYHLCPSKRPRKPKQVLVNDGPKPSDQVPSMAACLPGCRCVRHQA
jgi:hypothetical protein